MTECPPLSTLTWVTSKQWWRRFQKARQAFNKVLSSPQAAPLDLVGAYEGARLHLTLSELDECEAALERMDEVARHHQGLGFCEPTARWAVVTRARLLLKRGRPHEALDWLRNTEQRAKEVAHLPSTTALHLAAAEANVVIGDLSAAAEHLTAANVSGEGVFREFQAQSYYTASLLARAVNRGFAAHLRERAIRLSSHQGAVAVRMQVEAEAHPNEAKANTPLGARVEIIADALAASVDLAYSPRLLGAELLTVIKELECSPQARVAETGADIPQSTVSGELFLQLGHERRKNVNPYMPPSQRTRQGSTTRRCPPHRPRSAHAGAGAAGGAQPGGALAGQPRSRNRPERCSFPTRCRRCLPPHAASRRRTFRC